MPVVTLRPPLQGLAGGAKEVLVDGASVGEALRALERAHPPLCGWIVDEHGRVREHVNVFLRGERVREDAGTAAGDVLHVLSALSGGC